MRAANVLIVAVVSLFVFPVSHVAQETIEVPFDMPVPSGWRTETLPFPLSFAPELDYEGLEELRFSPGMFQEIKADYWSYAFVWWVPEGTEFETQRLQTDLDSYFNGLNTAVAEAQDFELGESVVSVQLEQAESESGASRWKGKARTLDVFGTRQPVKLNVTIDIVECPQQEHVAAFFLLSPQPTRHNIWEVLNGMRTGFRCEK